MLVTVICVLIAIVLAVWFIPITAGHWEKQVLSEGYTGTFERNDVLDELMFLEIGSNLHPEAVLVRDGWVYCTVSGGKLIKVREDGSDLTQILNTGGCLLGFDFDGEGNIIIADCDYNGTGALLKVADNENSQPEVLVSRELGCELYYVNAVTVAFAFTEDGTVTESLQSGSNGYYRSTGATETQNRLYIQSINDVGKLAYIQRP